MRSLLIGRVHLLWGLPHSYIWRHRLAVRTRDFHSRNRSSILRGVTSSALRGDRRLWLSKYKTENSLW